MAEIINLRLARKRKARVQKNTIAENNRVKHGIPKQERNTAKIEKSSADTKIDNHRIERNNTDFKPSDCDQ